MLRGFRIRRLGFAPQVAMGLLLAWLATAQALAQSTDLPNRKDPLEGITTAGQPNGQQLAAAAASGFKSVIDLRGPLEDRGMDEKAAVEALGMSYIGLPVEGAGELPTATRPRLTSCSLSYRARY
jgi:hypothetical protein